MKPKSGERSAKLSAQQAALLEQHRQECTYLHVKSIVNYVKFTWGVDYSVEGLTQWLKRHRFSYKKPKLVPGKANREEQMEWIQEYEKLKAELPEDETICFIDGVHPTHNVQLGYGWIKKGAEKEIPANSGRRRLNLTGAIDIRSHNIVIQEDRALNTDATIHFFEKLEQSQLDKRRVRVFCDNARYYRNKQVTSYLERSRIQLHFLPPYSPNLNPIERLWKWMRETILYNTYYEDFDDFRMEIRGFFRTLNGLDPKSELGRNFKTRIRDKFRAIGLPTPAQTFT